MLQIRIYDAQTNTREEIRIFRTSSHSCFSDSARAAVAAPGSCEPSRMASRPSGFDPSRKRLRNFSPGALGKGSRRHGACRRRYHCPCPGCPLNRSRRCTRSRVPPSASLCSRSCGCHFPFALTPACAGFSPFGLPSLTEPRREWRRIGVGDRRCRRARVGRRSP